MLLNRRNLRALGLIFSVAGMAFLYSPARAFPPSTIDQLSQHAEILEEKQQWGKACTVYATILEHQRHAAGVYERYLYCLRRYFQSRRHSDPSYHKEVLSLEFAQSLRLYEFILDYLSKNAIDLDRVTPKSMFLKGVQELRHALDHPVFVKKHLRKTSPARIREFRQSLKKWKNHPIYTIPQVVDIAHEIAISARKALNLRPTTSIMEFTCGSCYAVDDYTLYLTPSELRGLCTTLKGETAGIGVDLGIREDQLVVLSVSPDSPADIDVKPGVGVFDQIVSIDGRDASKLPPEVAMDLLRGEPGTEVVLEVYTPGMGTRVVTLERRLVFQPSVVYELKTMEVGYIGIRSFQESTADELDAAMAALAKMETKTLILDLRGNSGGLFSSAIEVARRFLAAGVITSTQAHGSKEKTTYQSDNIAAFTLPMVVLVDGNTASAGEILAGALKENGRARVVGQTTFGKGCIQEVYGLSPRPGVGFPGGLRITVARFLSPNGVPYTGAGVEPHIVVERAGPPMAGMDSQLEAAILEAQRLSEYPH